MLTMQTAPLACVSFFPEHDPWTEKVRNASLNFTQHFHMPVKIAQCHLITSLTDERDVTEDRIH